MNDLEFFCLGVLVGWVTKIPWPLRVYRAHRANNARIRRIVGRLEGDVLLKRDGRRYRALVKGAVPALDVYDNAQRNNLVIASEDSIARRCDTAIQSTEVKP